MRKTPRALELFSQAPRRNLACFDVRLVECVDAEDRTCHGGRDFPAEELLAQAVGFFDGNANDGIAGALETADRPILGGIRCRFEASVDEHAIVAVPVRRTNSLVINGNEPLAGLSCRLSEQLFEPRTEVCNPR